MVQVTVRMAEHPPATCSMCGSCCNPVLTDIAPERIEELWTEWETTPPDQLNWTKDNKVNFPFVHAHWTNISRDEAVRRNPFLAETNQYLYLCDQYNEVTHECMAHGTRPPICSGYPWYGKRPTRSRLYNPECSYHSDLPVKQGNE